MKIIQSYWTSPNFVEGKVPKSGWTHGIFEYMSWALSCLKWKQYYDRVELVTDNKGKELLIDKIQLPYTSVTTELNDIKKYIPYNNLWAVGKIYAYHIQKEPFLHVDGDVFIWRRLPDYFQNSTLIAQQIEYQNEFHLGAYKEISQNLDYIPEIIKTYVNKKNRINQINAGIIGGNDMAFFKEYTCEAIKFIDNNLHKLNTLKTSSAFPCMFEQFLFYCIAHERKKDISYLLHKENMEQNFKGLADFHLIPEASYIHLLGFYKEEFYNGEMIAHRLWHEFPVYYKRIVDLHSKGLI
jgi:hypothetical protein